MSILEDRYEGTFLEAIDLPEGVVAKVVIEALVPPDKEQDAAGNVIKKAILAFQGRKKRLILNKTNYRMLKVILGADPVKWIGQEVGITRRYLDAKHAFGVENEMCIRVIPSPGTPIPKSVRDFLGSRIPAPRP